MTTHFTLHSPDIITSCIRFIQSLPGHELWDVTIAKHRSKRSLSQNSLYWLWMDDIADQARTRDGQNLSKEEWHHLCSMRFLGVKTITLQGKEIPVPVKSTARLNTKEFTDYLTQIEAEFLNRGVVLTFPDCYAHAMGTAQQSNREEN